MEIAASRAPRFADVQEMSQVRQLLWARPVFWNLFSRAVRGRYHHTMLGFLWCLLNPTFNLLIYSFAFTVVFQIQLESYGVHLLAGLLPFLFFRGSVASAADNLISNAQFYKKQYMPKLIFPIVGLCANLLDFLVAYAVLLTLGYFVLGFRPAVEQLFIPVSLLLLVAFTLGCALIMSIAATYYADLQHIFNVLMQATFYATPVLWTMSMVPPQLQRLIKLNPLYYFVMNFTLPLYFHQTPDTTQILISAILAIVALVVGLAVFFRYQADVVFRV